jgi:hypothetical protein
LPITLAQLKRNLLVKINADAGGGGVVNSCLIAPNKFQQYAKIQTMCGYLGGSSAFPLPALPPFPLPICRMYAVAELARLRLLIRCLLHLRPIVGSGDQDCEKRLKV